MSYHVYEKSISHRFHKCITYAGDTLAFLSYMLFPFAISLALLSLETRIRKSTVAVVERAEVREHHQYVQVVAYALANIREIETDALYALHA